MVINKKLIAYNFNRGGNSKQYIVIHDTGNTRAGANAESHFRYFNGGNRNASAHYFVDDTQIIQTVEDSDRAWHAGVKHGTATRPEVNNSNSIGIEICVNADGDYEKAFKNTVEFTAHLMRKHGIDLKNVVTHFEACAKICPASMSGDTWRKWGLFKLETSYKLNPTKDTPEAESSVRFDIFGTKTADIEGFIKDGTTYVKARQLLEIMGHSVEWDTATRTVMIRHNPLIHVTDEELEILEKIVHAEAGGEDEKGKVLVCNVIFNRLNDERFPDTIKDVVFQERQFEPTRNGAYERAVPSTETKTAVARAIFGEDFSQGARFFRTIRGATADSWHETALTKLFDWGNHRFYL